MYLWRSVDVAHHVEEVEQGAPPDGEGGAKGEDSRSVRTSGSDERASAAIAATGSRVVRAWPGERAATDVSGPYLYTILREVVLVPQFHTC